MGCSSLNSHLTIFLHVLNDPSGACGFNMETPKHYFLHCPIHVGPRQQMITNILRYTDCNINTTLFGDRNLTLEQNRIIFQSVHNFIKDSKGLIREWSCQVSLYVLLFVVVKFLGIQLIACNIVFTIVVI